MQAGRLHHEPEIELIGARVVTDITVSYRRVAPSVAFAGAAGSPWGVAVMTVS
jgi:hypothetical protein